jgi:hypothetical protein
MRLTWSTDGSADVRHLRHEAGIGAHCPGSLSSIWPGSDTVTGTASNDTVNGTAATLNAGDSLGAAGRLDERMANASGEAE